MAGENLHDLKALLNDAEIINALRTDENSVHWHVCIAYLKMFVGNRFPSFSHETIEDAAQEAIILIYRNFPTFRRDSKFTTWISAIAFHHAIDILRKQKGKNTWETQVYDNQDEDKDVLSLIASKEDPVKYVLHQERMQEFRVAVEEFLRKRRKSTRDRAILAKIFQGHSYQQIADEHGVDVSVVGAVYYSLRKFMKEQSSGGMPNK